MKRLAKQMVLSLARRSLLMRNVAAFIVDQTSVVRDTYGYLKEKFIENGQNSRFDRSLRKEIVSWFERIDNGIDVLTTPSDGLFLAEMLLNMEAEGDVIECGCAAGGSSAKLSIVAKLLNRKLIIFDSFEGLPMAEQEFSQDRHCRRRGVVIRSEGKYAAQMDIVQQNLERYGEPSVCRLVKGWFDKTLVDGNLPQQAAFAFTDVDLASSARDCFVTIWPRLSEKGIYATHDTAYLKVLKEIYNPELWRDCFKAIPPIFFGAGFGLCNASPHLGYMVKGENLSVGYLKSLTIDK